MMEARAKLVEVDSQRVNAIKTYCDLMEYEYLHTIKTRGDRTQHILEMDAREAFDVTKKFNVN